MAKKTTGSISLEIRDAAAQKSLRNLSADLAKARKRWRAATKGTEEYNQAVKDIKVAKGAIKVHTDQIKDVGSSWDQVKNKVSSISGPLGALFSGPGAVFSIGIAGAGLLAKHMIEVNREFDGFRKLVVDVTGATGPLNTRVVADIKGIADTWDKEFNDVLQAANALSKQTGASISESISVIETGFLSGADATGELLSNLKEYPSALEGAKMDGEDLIRIIKAGVEEGIFSDKGIDAVKEFGIRIRENADAVKVSMENAFGKEFTNDLFSGINDGTLSVVDALVRVSDKMDDTTIPTNNLRAVIADVFGAAGEDAGEEYLAQLGEVISSTESLIDTTSELVIQKQIDLDLNQELADSQAMLAKSIDENGDAWDRAVKKMSIWGNKALAVTNSVISKTDFSYAKYGIGGFFTEMNNAIRETTQELGLFGRYSGLSLEEVEQNVESTKDKMQALADHIEKIESAKVQTRGSQSLLPKLKEELAALQEANPTIRINMETVNSSNGENTQNEGDSKKVDQGAIDKAREQAQKEWDARREVVAKEIENELKLTAKAESALAKEAIKANSGLGNTERKLALFELEKNERLRIEDEKIQELKVKAEDHNNYTQAERDQFLQLAETHEKNVVQIVANAELEKKQLVDQIAMEAMEQELGREAALKASADEKFEFLKQRIKEENDYRFQSAVELQQRLKELATEMGVDPEVLTEIEKSKAVELKDFKEQLDEEYYDKLAGKIQNNGRLVTDVANATADVTAALGERKLAKEKKRTRKEIQLLEEQKKAGIISEEEFQKKKATLENEYRAKERAIKRRQFVIDKVASIIQAAIATSVAVAQALPNVPLSIVTGALGAAQIAAIAAKPIPEFRKGGVAKGSRHSQGGIALVDSRSGLKVGEMEDGEPYMILSRDTYRNNAPIIDALLDSSMNHGGAPVYDGLSSYEAPVFSKSNYSTPYFESGGTFQSSSSSSSAEDTSESQTAVFMAMVEQMSAMNQNVAFMRQENNERGPGRAVVSLEQYNDANEEQKTLEDLSSLRA